MRPTYLFQVEVGAGVVCESQKVKSFQKCDAIAAPEVSSAHLERKTVSSLHEETITEGGFANSDGTRMCPKLDMA